MTDFATTCRCGAEVHIDLPDDERQRQWAEKLAHLVVCDECAKRHAGEEREAEEAERVRRARERLMASGIPAHWRTARLEQLNGSQPVEAATRWAAGDLTGLLLVGPVGVGKTHTAAAAAVTMLARRAVVWASAPVLMARLATDMGTPQHQAALDALIGRRALVLDDLDKIRPTNYGAEQLFAAIDSRVADGVPLLVTANLTLGEIARRYPAPHGEAIASRLAEHCERHDLTGQDRRMGGAA